MLTVRDENVRLLSEIETITRLVLRQVGDMMNSRFADLEDRLPPAPSSRPSLRTFALVAAQSTRTQAPEPVATLDCTVMPLAKPCTTDVKPTSSLDQTAKED